MVATRAAVDRCGAGYGVPPLVLQGGTANAALRGQKSGTSTRVGPAEYYELSSDDGRPTGGERPAALSEPWPQGKLMRHAGIGYEIVQSLDVLVPQMGEQLPNVVQFFAVQLPVVAEPGYRSAEDLPGQDSAALGGLSASAADGGPDGGCADCRVLFFAPAAYCRPDR